MDLSLANRKVLIVGAGESGLAAARLLLALGAKTTLLDQKSPAELAKALERAPAEVKWLFGPGPWAEPENSDLIVVSPGVPLEWPPLAAARAKGVPMVGEIELAFAHQSSPILAVTGSNGKTTTTGLTGHILAKALGAEPFVGGNIGRPFSELALAEIAAKKAGAAGQRPWAVLEVSSFQLETVKDFKAKGAALLNVSPDHLDRHGSLEGYFAAKLRIFANQGPSDWAVVNEDDPYLANFTAPGQRFGFSRKFRPPFGGTVYRLGDEEVLAVVKGDETLAEELWSEFLLIGAHNQENVLAAVGLAMAAGASPEAALAAAKSFPSGDHRLRLVAEIKGVRYYNDSKGTNVGAVARALESLKGPIVLIAGGRDKGFDFGYLRPLVQEKVRHLVLMGECREKMRDALAEAAPVHLVDGLSQAVQAAASLAAPGETVLLSPACASFDMFKDYRDRGEAFVKAVWALSDQVGP